MPPARPTTAPTSGRAAAVLSILVAAAAVWPAVAAGAPGDGRAAQAPTAAPAATRTATATVVPWEPGGTWAPVHAPRQDALWPGAVVPALRAVHGVRRPDGAWEAWAVGERCLMARFDGATWAPAADLEHRCGASAWLDLRDVFVKAPDEVWAVGRIADDRDCRVATPTDASDVGYEEGCGFVARFDGAQWRVLTAADVGVAGRLPPLNALDMAFDPDRGTWVGWAVGNDADFDNVKAMVLDYEPDEPGWNDAYAATNLIADLRDVKVLSYDEAWAVGEDGTESRFKRNAQGDATWRRNPLSGREHLYTVDLADPEYGWDGGWKGRMHHYDGNCHDDDDQTPCWFDNADRPVFGLDGVPMTAELYGIDLLGRGVGWLVGSRTTGASTVAHADGDHWKQAVVADDPVVDLYGVFLRDERGGWAVGDKGVILEYRDASAPTATETPAATASATPSPSPSATPETAATDTPAPTDAPSPTASATPTPPCAFASDGALCTPTAPPSATATPAEETPTAPAASATPTACPDGAEPACAATPTAPGPPSATPGAPGPPSPIFLPVGWRPRR